MKSALRIAAVGGLLAATVVGMGTPAPADSHVTTFLEGELQNPRGLAFDEAGNLYIAESGEGGAGPCFEGPEGYVCYGESGGIHLVTDLTDIENTASRLVDGLPSHASADNPDTEETEPTGHGAGGPADVSEFGGVLNFSIGLGADPAIRQDLVDDGATRANEFGTIRAVVAADGTMETEVADVAQHEADENPDEGAGAEEGHEIDSNPFGIVASAETIEVVDSGGNFQATVTIADESVETSAVFPPVMAPPPAFLGLPNGTRFPSQAVPTQLVSDGEGGFHTGLLTGFPFHHGASDIMATNGGLTTLLEGFTNVMDLAWGPDDMLYVLEHSHGGLLTGSPGALIRVDVETGTRELLADDLEAPGGIAFGPDGMAYITVGSDTPEGSLLQFDVENAPVLMSVTDDSATTVEDQPLDGEDAIDALANDAEDAVIRSIPDNSAGAIWESSVDYQPPAHFSGPDSITYEACASEDEDAACMLGVIDVTVEAQFVDRISGAGRIDTAIEASRALFPDGAPTVLISTEDKYPDALAGSVLSKLVGGPILLNPSNELRQTVIDEINRLGATTAYILGGDLSIQPLVETALTTQTTVETVDRVGGLERFETAKLIKEKIEEISGEDATEVYVTEGIHDLDTRGWPDAMSASSLAAHEGKPILLVRTDEVPDKTAEALAGVTTATIVGGPVAVSEATEDDIDAIVGTVGRLDGLTRYGTSQAVADAAIDAGLDPSNLWLASGGNWPDALVLGPLVAFDGGVMMLVHPTDINDGSETRAFLEANNPYLDIDLVGGPVWISEDVRAQIEEMAEQDS